MRVYNDLGDGGFRVYNDLGDGDEEIVLRDVDLVRRHWERLSTHHFDQALHHL